MGNSPRAWWEILKRAYLALSINHLSLLAAGVAYYAFLSITPLFAAVALTYGLVGAPQMVQRHYRFGPSRRHARLQWLVAGSVAATLFWLEAALAVSFYVSQFGNFSETYGSFGAVVVLQLWLFMSAYVVLLGAQINVEAEQQTSAVTSIGEPTQKSCIMALALPGPPR